MLSLPHTFEPPVLRFESARIEASARAIITHLQAHRRQAHLAYAASERPLVDAGATSSSARAAGAWARSSPRTTSAHSSARRVVAPHSCSPVLMMHAT